MWAELLNGFNGYSHYLTVTHFPISFCLTNDRERKTTFLYPPIHKTARSRLSVEKHTLSAASKMSRQLLRTRLLESAAEEVSQSSPWTQLNATDDNIGETSTQSSNANTTSTFGATSGTNSFFDFAQSDCDPSTSRCNITAYHCTNSQSFLTIPYDYEVHYQALTTVDIDQLLPLIEESMLEKIATDMNLKACAKSFGDRRGLQTYSNIELDRLTGVSLLPRDGVTMNACLATLDNVDAASTACRAIKGSMTVYTLLTQQESMNGQTTLSAEEKSKLQLSILNSVERGMNEGLFVASSDIDELVYIGDRSAYIANTSASSGMSSGLGSTQSSLAAGLLSTAIILTFGAVAALCYIYWKLKRDYKNRYIADTSSREVSSMEDSVQTADKINRTQSNASSIATRTSMALPRQDSPTDYDSNSGSSGNMLPFSTPTTMSFEGLHSETTTDIENYQFSFEQGISSRNETFDDLYDDLDLPMTYDEGSQE